MSKKKRVLALFLPLVIIISIFALKFWAQVGCIEYVETITENFNTELYKNTEYSSVAYWPPGPVTLNWLGGNLDVTTPAGMGAMIYVCDAGDFNGDNLPDLIGLDVSVAGDDKLVLLRNRFEDLDLDGVDDDGLIFDVDPFETYDWGYNVGPAAITTGDYNNDGLIDFFFLENELDSANYQNFVACMYINSGTVNDPDFARYFNFPNLDFSQKFIDAGIYVRWAADHMVSVDIDRDGDTDILVVSQNEIYLVRNPGSGSFDLANFTITEISYDLQPGFPTGVDMGGSSIDAADFDNDGDTDIVVGSVEWVPYLVYYENDGTGNYTRFEIPIPNTNCIGTVATCVDDFDHDGLIDIICANDMIISGNLARMYVFRNKGVIEGGSPPIDFQFECLDNCDPILPPAYDCDMGISVDYDLDGDVDVIFADANNSGDYFLVINQLANVYTTFGEARSLNLASLLDTQRSAITKAKISSLKQGRRGGTSQGLRIEYYLSNNGTDWEFFAAYDGTDIHDYTDLPEYTFTNFGSQLLWKAVFSAPEDPMADYVGASFDTPFIDEITFEFTHVDQKEYSRTSVAATVMTDEEEQKKLIIGSTFYYPGWQGHLRAYDVSTMTADDTTYSVLKTVSRPDLSAPSGREIVPEGVEILWDAGELLDSRSASDRVIYTATPVASVLTRIDFTAANVGTLGPILQDVNNDNEGLINFIRGEGRDWKLGDSNHSNPIVIGPPIENPSLMGGGYQDFTLTWINRRKVLYLGANDGMLHCFDALTGEELWAFIPYNLLPRIKNMWAVDATTGVRYFERDVYVDGSPVAADVYIDPDGDGTKEWKTIIICGQGPGSGSTLAGGLNYYFALDVTDPDGPQPLWEFYHERLGETWSVPVVGRVVKNGEDTWAAFMGSGYDNDPDRRTGNYFYAVDVEDGNSFWFLDTVWVDTQAKHGRDWDIRNTMPCSPAIVDVDQDGYADRVYIGDLDGRLWKVDISIEFEDSSSWDGVIIYEDSKNYPIVSSPAVWLNPVSAEVTPRLYFGTGGDDGAPNDLDYSFIALLDGVTPEVEWFLGDATLLGIAMEKDVGDLDTGAKVWADPQVADFIVYFSTLIGSIESVDPCESLAGVGKLYARFIQAEAGTLIGGTAIETVTGPVESLELSIKTRAAVTLGERQRTSEGTRKREVYIQQYDSTIQKLEQFAIALLKVRSWREIFRIIR